MKNTILGTVILILQFLCYYKISGQSLDSLLAKHNLPKNLRVIIKNDTAHLDNFKTIRCATVRFNNDKKSVFYHVFPYNHSDSLEFSKGEDTYSMGNNCPSRLNRNPKKNFHSFTKGGYYFLLQLCVCPTTDNPDCEILAKTLNEWTKK